MLPPTRLLVTSAGTGASNNLIRSLRAGDPSLRIVGCHGDRFVLKKSAADRNHLVRPPDHPEFGASLRRVIAQEDIDLLVPNSDADVLAVSAARTRLRARLFLPGHTVIERCQDKYALSAFLGARGVPVPLTFPVTGLAELEDVFRRLGSPARAWCRIRTGGGSRGAIPVARPEQARNWIAYWAEMRGVPIRAFTLSEYLPGRDFAAQGLWQDGALVLLKLCERLSYFGGGSQPSGTSSTPALGKLVHDRRVADVCRRALEALDPAASGVFSIDLKENGDGVPCVTEINAGRFCMITPLFDLTGKYNMAATYVRLALGEPVEVREEYDAVEDHYLVRDLDTLPDVIHADALFEESRRQVVNGSSRRARKEKRHVLRRYRSPDVRGRLQGQGKVEEEEGPQEGAGRLPASGEERGQRLQGELGRDLVSAPADETARIRVTGDLDRQAVEALVLEARRLAERCGVEIEEVRIAPTADGPS